MAERNPFSDDASARPTGNTVQSALDAGRKAALKLLESPFGARHGRPYFITKDALGGEVAVFVTEEEALLPHPIDKAGVAKMHDLNSFLSYWKEHSIPVSRIYAEMIPQVRFTGVIDEHDPDGDPVQEITSIKDELAATCAELERERIRLAACGVVALANTPESAARAREMHDEYRSASCDDAARAVDEQMRLRAELARAMRVVEAAAWMRSAYKLDDNVAEEAETRLWGAITEWEAGR